MFAVSLARASIVLSNKEKLEKILRKAKCIKLEYKVVKKIKSMIIKKLADKVILEDETICDVKEGCLDTIQSVGEYIDFVLLDVVMSVGKEYCSKLSNMCGFKMGGFFSYCRSDMLDEILDYFGLRGKYF